MGLFGGPNFEKMIANRDFDKLRKILVNDNKEKQQAQARDAFAQFGQEGTKYLVSSLLSEGDWAPGEKMHIRKALMPARSFAVQLLIEPFQQDDESNWQNAIKEIGYQGDPEAIQTLMNSLGPKGTRYMVSVLLEDENLPLDVVKYFRAILKSDCILSIEILSEELEGQIKVHRFKRALEELGFLGAPEAIPVLNDVLRFFENKYGLHPHQLSDDMGQMAFVSGGIAAAARSLYTLGSDMGILVMIRTMRVHVNKLWYCQLIGMDLEKITCVSFEQEYDVRNWVQWWNSLGRSLDVEIPPNLFRSGG